MVARPNVQCLFLFTEQLHRHGYEDVMLHTINIQEPTVIQNSPYIYPHVQSQSSRAPNWPSPPACCGLVLPANGRFSRLTQGRIQSLSLGGRSPCRAPLPPLPTPIPPLLCLSRPSLPYPSPPSFPSLSPPSRPFPPLPLNRGVPGVLPRKIVKF